MIKTQQKTRKGNTRQRKHVKQKISINSFDRNKYEWTKFYEKTKTYLKPNNTNRLERDIVSFAMVHVSVTCISSYAIGKQAHDSGILQRLLSFLHTSSQQINALASQVIAAENMNAAESTRKEKRRLVRDVHVPHVLPLSSVLSIARQGERRREQSWNGQ